jgi:hypothetical protein
MKMVMKIVEVLILRNLFVNFGVIAIAVLMKMVMKNLQRERERERECENG